MLENALKQPKFKYRACGPFGKNETIIKRLKKKETRDSRYIYQSELDKACFQHDLAYGDFQDLNRKTAADKVLHDKLFDFAKIPKFPSYQVGRSSMFYRFFDKERLVAISKMKIFLIKN